MENSSDIPKMISNLLNRGGVVVKPPVEPLNGAHLWGSLKWATKT